MSGFFTFCCSRTTKKKNVRRQLHPRWAAGASGRRPVPADEEHVDAHVAHAGGGEDAPQWRCKAAHARSRRIRA